MTDIRDIGYVAGSLEPAPQYVEIIKNTQVYTATHDRAGNRLPYMNRSFISFSYGGKFIEDMGFIVINENNQVQRKFYADFADNVMENDVYDGQNYWSTHFKANTLQLTVATDGVTERQLDEFKYWFKPGVIRELILAEHPNRAILARVSEVPEPEFLPFESSATTTLMGVTYTTSTTLYRGQMQISFVMDDPFWYSQTVVFEKDGNTWFNPNDANNQQYCQKDAVKICIEDGIPLVAEREEQEISFGESIFFGDRGYMGYAAYVDSAQVDITELSYSIFSTLPDSVTLAPNTDYYFYYAGNAPCSPKLSFTITPIIGANNSDMADYIISPKNKITATGAALPYNVIIFAAENQKEFRFTTPSIWTGYNQAIQIFKTIGMNVAWEEVRAAVRDNVKHFAPRAYAIKVIDEVESDAPDGTTDTALLQAIAYMRDFLSDEDGNICSAHFSFDGEKLISRGQFSYRSNIITQSSQETPQIESIEEDIGDVMKSGYLTMEERNYPDDEGLIRNWEYSHNASYKFNHNVTNSLDDFKLEYKYMYL